MKASGAIWRDNWREGCIAACLFLLVLAVYAPVRNFDFINYDDPVYVTLNRHVTAGLTPESLRWAFTTAEGANWFPLTWISLMADCQFFGAGAGPQHVTNAILHAVDTLLLFALFTRLTGALWPSTMVAFLFGFHPQHVQSVAWITERKDVLSAFFWLLTIWAYARYVATRKPSHYLLSLLLYCLGFMAKPIVVTLPVILILLDIWPLKRVSTDTPRTLFSRKAAGALLWDKLPFLGMAIAMSVVTVYVQSSGQAVVSLENWPLSRRLGNAAVSAIWYIVKTIWPSRLSIFYPAHQSPSAWVVAAACCAMLVVTLLVALTVRTRPFLLVGWLWYAIAVLPVIGIVQVGEQAHADRYTYLPGIGLSIMLAWSIEEAWKRWPKTRPAWIGLCGAAGIACLVMTSKEVSYWQNSKSLFRRAIEITENNDVAHTSLGDALRVEGHYEDAIGEYRKALAIQPNAEATLVNYGAALGALGRTDEAKVPIRAALRLKHDDPKAHTALGLVLGLQGRLPEAQQQFEIAILLDPESEMAHTQLGKTLGNLGRMDDAITEFSLALRLKPDSTEAREALEKALAVKNQIPRH